MHVNVEPPVLEFEVEEILSGQIWIGEDSLVDRELKSLNVFGEPRVQRHHVILRVFEPNGVCGFVFGFHDKDVSFVLRSRPDALSQPELKDVCLDQLTAYAEHPK